MVFDPDSEGGNTILVEAADPEPPSLHCRIFNKGYIDTTLRFYTEVSNDSWMSQYPLRIDSNNFNDHDNEVKSNTIKARTTRMHGSIFPYPMEPLFRTYCGTPTSTTVFWASRTQNTTSSYQSRSSRHTE